MLTCETAINVFIRSTYSVWYTSYIQRISPLVNLLRPLLNERVQTKRNKTRYLKAGTYRKLPREKLKTQANPLQLFRDMAPALTLANREY